MPDTNVIISYAIIIGFSYFLGSANFSIIISKITAGADIRDMGSGNAGATNVLRSLGAKAVLWVSLGDIGKAVASVVLGRMLGGELGGWIGGLFCIFGHVFPVFFQFKGGKGVLSAAAVILCLNPLMWCILIVAFVVLMFAFRTVSLASVSAAVVLIISCVFLPIEIYQAVVACLIAIFVLWRHKDNIKRLIAGTEPKTTIKKKEG